MAKDYQERPHRICHSLSILGQDEPRHKIQKHHNLKSCPLCRYQNKRSTQFNTHLRKARGLRATAEARRLEKKKTAALADGLEKLVTTNAPAPLTPPVHPAPSSSIAQPHDDPKNLTPNTNKPSSLDSSVQHPPISDPAIHYIQEYKSLCELPLNEEQGLRRSSDTLPYTLPRTPLSSAYMNTDGSFDRDNNGSLASSPRQDELGEEKSPKLSFLPKDLDLGWDNDWDLDFSQYARAGMRVTFESNERLYDASLAYLLSYDPLPR